MTRPTNCFTNHETSLVDQHVDFLGGWDSIKGDTIGHINDFFIFDEDRIWHLALVMKNWYLDTVVNPDVTDDKVYPSFVIDMLRAAGQRCDWTQLATNYYAQKN